MEDRILFEDNHLLFVNKKPGELVQGDITGDYTLEDRIKYYIKTKYNKPGSIYLGVVHRLDRPTSGVLVFAKTSKAANRLSKQFKTRNIRKKYWALVSKEFPNKNGSLTNWMSRNKRQNKSKAHKFEVPNSKIATLHFKRIQQFDRYCLLEIDLETGRHHQIRAQFSNIGYPIQGDIKYGAKRPNKDASISLHAKELKIEHPVKKEILLITADPLKVGIWKSVLFGL